MSVPKQQASRDIRIGLVGVLVALVAWLAMGELLGDVLTNDFFKPLFLSCRSLRASLVLSSTPSRN